MDLSIIILNYKTKNLVKECIKCIKLCRLELNYEIIVVDNNSKDETIEMVKENFFDVRYIGLSKNLGFAAGNNLGIKIARGRNILILNPDMALKSNTLEKMITYLDAHREVGILAPKLVNPDGSLQYSCFKYPNFLMPLFRRTSLGDSSFGKKIINEYTMSDWDHRDIREIDWALGACLLMPKKVLDRVGLFDENFFLYLEDADLCRRVKKAGYKVMYFSESTLIHFHRRESAHNRWFKIFFHKPTREHIKSWFRYFKKWGFRNC